VRSLSVDDEITEDERRAKTDLFSIKQRENHALTEIGLLVCVVQNRNIIAPRYSLIKRLQLLKEYGMIILFRITPSADPPGS
jgi:hypothetical protein